MGADRRVTLVTGAGKGLGRAFALACARRGDRVVVNNRVRPGAPDSAAETVAAIEAMGGTAAAERSDIVSPEAPEALREAALSAFGRLDAVIFNAGVEGEAGPVDTRDPADIDHVLRTNLSAQIALTQAVLAPVRASDAGRLVYIASAAGLHGLAGRAAYAASKGALIAFARSLAGEEFRAGPRVNVAAPYAATRMTEGFIEGETARRFSPDAAARIAAWLAGPDCRRTGEVWVCGAEAARPAACMEGRGGPLPDPLGGPGALDALDGFDEAAGFRDGTKAFLDFVARTGGGA